jgi:hypothetical protein
LTTGVLIRARLVLGLCAGIAGLAMTAGLTIAEPAGNEARPLTFSLTTDAWTGYWYRGTTVTDRLTVQPSGALCFESAGIEVGFWSSYALDDRDRLGSADEIDLILNYTKPFAWAGQTGSIGVGYTEYFFTASGGSSSRTGEVTMCAAIEGFLAPSITAFYDVDLYDETYVEAMIEPEIALASTDGPAIVLTARVGAGKYGEPFGLRSTEFSSGLRFQTGSMSLTPRVGYGYAPAGPEKGTNLFFGGFSISFGE